MPQPQVLALVLPVVMGLVGAVKPFIEAWKVPPGSKLHDPFFVLLVIVLCAIGAGVEYLVSAQRVDALGFWSSLGAGLVVGLATNGLYRVGKGDWTPTPPAGG